MTNITMDDINQAEAKINRAKAKIAELQSAWEVALNEEDTLLRVFQRDLHSKNNQAAWWQARQKAQVLWDELEQARLDKNLTHEEYLAAQRGKEDREFVAMIDARILAKKLPRYRQNAPTTGPIYNPGGDYNDSPGDAGIGIAVLLAIPACAIFIGLIMLLVH